MEKKIIDTNLQAMLEHNEIETVKMIYDILHDIFVRYGDITDSDIKKYNNENNQYQINISINTVRNYLKNYHYTIRKNANCIVREMTVDEYANTVLTANKNKDNNNVDDFINNLTVKQKISLAYADKSELYNNLKLMSLRCSTDVLDRFNEMSKKYRCFEKSYLLSYVLEIGMDSIGYHRK